MNLNAVTRVLKPMSKFKPRYYNEKMLLKVCLSISMQLKCYLCIKQLAHSISYPVNLKNTYKFGCKTNKRKERNLQICSKEICFKKEEETPGMFESGKLKKLIYAEVIMFPLMILEPALYPVALLKCVFTNLSNLELHHALCSFCLGFSRQQRPI